MAKVSTFLYAENCRYDGNRKLNIINPLQIFTPAFIPGQFSFAVAFGILGVDFSESRQAKYILRGPDGEIIIDSGMFKIPIPDDPTTHSLPDEMKGAFLNIDVRNAILKTEGVYNSEVYLDDVRLGVFPIQVKSLN